MLWVQRWIAQLGGAFLFYTSIPLPQSWTLTFSRIARFAPFIGLLIGAGLGLADSGLRQLGLPVLPRSALVVAAWLMVTGGLHLDGAMDTADGLAVQDPQKRLSVMADSVTGAFGAMTAVIVMGLKAAALSELHSGRWLSLMAVAGWGRWGQVAAIAFYPYLKPTGKGAFHKQNICYPWDLLPGLIGLIFLGLAQWAIAPDLGWRILANHLAGLAIALLIGAWFNYKLGGHTGDTYGAVVEWTEALLLCWLTRE
ncbi:MAG: adenosylcobinamide-GDP ribazoletransferase [Leptolyngbyaceae cyanobacterium SL_1_1]|nr:adenosylcobinamide-GDP ribazoletransferase [Leptolyngbyaceae cyanobacterium SL_1_1]